MQQVLTGSSINFLFRVTPKKFQSGSLPLVALGLTAERNLYRDPQNHLQSVYIRALPNWDQGVISVTSYGGDIKYCFLKTKQGHILNLTFTKVNGILSCTLE